MAEQSLEAIKQGHFDHLKNVAFLEEANNRFTTTCRRLLNKKGHKKVELGPIYYVIEELENIADQYKYLCKYIYSKKNKKIKIDDEVIRLFEGVNEMVKIFYEVFYKFNKAKIVEIGNKRKDLVGKAYGLFEKDIDATNNVLVHYLLVLAQDIFCLVGPFLVIAL